MKIFCFLFVLIFVCVGYPYTAKKIIVPQNSFSHSKPIAGFYRVIGFSKGQLIFDEKSAAPYGTSLGSIDISNYSSYCVLSIRTVTENFVKIDLFNLAEFIVSMDELEAGNKPENPTQVYSDINNYRIWHRDRFLNKKIRLPKLQDQEQLLYYFADIECSKSGLSVQYSEDLKNGILTDDYLINENLGFYLKE